MSVGEELLAHGGADAIGANHKICLDHRSVREPRNRARASKIDRPQFAAGMVALVWKAGPQQGVDALPGSNGLRAGMAHQLAAVRIEQDTRLDLHTDRPDVADAGGGQRLAQLRLGDDASAPSRQCAGRTFVDVDLPAMPLQQ